jgi:RNA polymerase sigma-70 factor, ECF subfamily
MHLKPWEEDMAQEREKRSAHSSKAAKALERVINTHYQQIYNFLCWLCRDPEWTADLTQETFMAAWRDIGGLRDSTRLEAWLHMIARNVFLQARRRRPEPTTALDEQQAAIATGPEQQVLRRLELHRLLMQVPATEREAVILHKLQGLSCEDIAFALDRPVGTVKRQISTALHRMQEIVNQENISEGERGENENENSNDEPGKTKPSEASCL